MTEDQIDEIYERNRLNESIRVIAKKMELTYYTVWRVLQERKYPEPAPQESDDQSNSESQSDLSPVEAAPPVIVDELERSVLVDERSRRILRIAELFGMDGAEILVFAGLVYSLGFKSIGEFVKERVEPLMKWVLKMEARLKQEVTPEMLDRLWLDGAQAASIMNKIQRNKKLWAYVQDYLN